MFMLMFAIFVALAAVHVDDGLACCYPVRMEGARYHLKQKVTKYFVADYERGYIFQTEQIGGPNFTIHDLQEKKKYTVSGSECSERPLIAPKLFDPCLDDDNMVESNAILGEGDEEIHVDFYDYQVGPFSIFKAVQLGENGCIPVTTQTTFRQYALTTMFHNVQTDISFPGIFSTLEICNVEVRGADEQGDF